MEDANQPRPRSGRKTILVATLSVVIIASGAGAYYYATNSKISADTDTTDPGLPSIPGVPTEEFTTTATPIAQVLTTPTPVATPVQSSTSSNSSVSSTSQSQNTSSSSSTSSSKTSTKTSTLSNSKVALATATAAVTDTAAPVSANTDITSPVSVNGSDSSSLTTKPVSSSAKTVSTTKNSIPTWLGVVWILMGACIVATVYLVIQKIRLARKTSGLNQNSELSPRPALPGDQNPLQNVNNIQPATTANTPPQANAVQEMQSSNTSSETLVR